MNATATQRPAPQPIKFPKRPAALPPNALKRADLERGHFFCIVPIETTFEEVMTPAYWQHVISYLSGGATPRPFARIEVVRADGTMDLDLRVLQTAPGMAVVRCLRKFIDGEAKGAETSEDEGESMPLPDGYKTVHIPSGEKKGWRVTLPNGEELVGKLLRRKDAVRAAVDHYAKASAAPVEQQPEKTPDTPT